MAFLRIVLKHKAFFKRILGVQNSLALLDKDLMALLLDKDPMCQAACCYRENASSDEGLALLLHHANVRNATMDRYFRAYEGRSESDVFSDPTWNARDL